MSVPITLFDPDASWERVECTGGPRERRHESEQQVDQVVLTIQK